MITPRARLGRRVVEVVSCSIVVTTFAAIVAAGWHASVGTRWALAFVIGRWILIALILALPFVERARTRIRQLPAIPWALRTPWTPLLLMCESIVIDIISARLRGG